QGGNLSRDSLETAADGAVSATKAFASDLKQIGLPSASGTEAKQQLDTLSSQLSADADKIKAATASLSSPTDVLNAVSVVSSTLVAAKDHASSTADQLKALDPKGKLTDAFA